VDGLDLVRGILRLARIAGTLQTRGQNVGCQERSCIQLMHRRRWVRSVGRKMEFKGGRRPHYAKSLPHHRKRLRCQEAPPRLKRPQPVQRCYTSHVRLAQRKHRCQRQASRRCRNPPNWCTDRAGDGKRSRNLSRLPSSPNLFYY
jgi:hypothetical protein